MSRVDVLRNVERVERGLALDMPLAVLDGEMKKEYITKPCQKAYRQTPEYKAWEKAYQQTPEYKAYKKAYYLRNKKKILAKQKRGER
jgi:hypothetical protein